MKQAARLPKPKLQVPMAKVVVADVGEHGPDVVGDLKPTLAKLFVVHGTKDAHGIHPGGEPTLGEPLTLLRRRQAVTDRRDGPLVRHAEWDHQAARDRVALLIL